MLAASQGQLEAVQLLVSRGADVDAIDEEVAQWIERLSGAGFESAPRQGRFAGSHGADARGDSRTCGHRAHPHESRRG